MAGETLQDEWSSGDAYEAYVGRWSRLVARELLEWLDVGERLRWLDVGCGTGALTAAIVDLANPVSVVGIDASTPYVEDARRRIDDPRVRFEVVDATALRVDEDFDVAASGLMLNFVPDAAGVVTAMANAVTDDGVVATYVWDYAGRMDLLRRFWDAAVALDPAARELDEGLRFPLCNPSRLADVWEKAGLGSVETTAIDVPTVFTDFDDLWSPFLGGQGPAPGYVQSRAEPDRDALRELLRASLPVARDGSIALVARAWAVRGRPKRPAR
jgi:SAM-dependent methyltransferase